MVVLFESISARRRGRGHKSSLSPANTDADDSAAITKSKSNRDENHKSKSLFYIYSQTTSFKSIFIAAALMLVIFPLVQESHLNLRYQSQSDGSIMQTHLTEAEAIKAAGSRKAITAAAATTTYEEKLNDTEIVDSKVEELQHPPTLKYTSELAARAVEPTVWTCGEKDRQAQAALDPIRWVPQIGRAHV